MCYKDQVRKMIVLMGPAEFLATAEDVFADLSDLNRDSGHDSYHGFKFASMLLNRAADRMAYHTEGQVYVV